MPYLWHPGSTSSHGLGHLELLSFRPVGVRKVSGISWFFVSDLLKRMGGNPRNFPNFFGGKWFNFVGNTLEGRKGLQIWKHPKWLSSFRNLLGCAVYLVAQNSHCQGLLGKLEGSCSDLSTSKWRVLSVKRASNRMLEMGGDDGWAASNKMAWKPSWEQIIYSTDNSISGAKKGPLIYILTLQIPRPLWTILKFPTSGVPKAHSHSHWHIKTASSTWCTWPFSGLIITTCLLQYLAHSSATSAYLICIDRSGLGLQDLLLDSTEAIRGRQAQTWLFAMIQDVYQHLTGINEMFHPAVLSFLGGGFKYFFIFTPIWGRFPFWLIFFKGVETTN